MSRWSKEGIPHKGWECIDVIDLGEGVFEGEAIPYESCEMCDQEKIRYIHILKHPNYCGEIHVGCDCASKMTDDYVSPPQRENDLRNRANRRRNFMKQSWRVKPETGNYVLRYKGDYITIVKNQYGGFGVVFKGIRQWNYCGNKILDFDTARIVAFNLFDELHESY